MPSEYPCCQGCVSLWMFTQSWIAGFACWSVGAEGFATGIAKPSRRAIAGGGDGRRLACGARMRYLGREAAPVETALGRVSVSMGRHACDACGTSLRSREGLLDVEGSMTPSARRMASAAAAARTGGARLRARGRRRVPRRRHRMAAAAVPGLVPERGADRGLLPSMAADSSSNAAWSETPSSRAPRRLPVSASNFRVACRRSIANWASARPSCQSSCQPVSLPASPPASQSSFQPSFQPSFAGPVADLLEVSTLREYIARARLGGEFGTERWKWYRGDAIAPGGRAVARPKVPHSIKQLMRSVARYAETGGSGSARAQPVHRRRRRHPLLGVRRLRHVCAVKRP